MDSLLGLFTKVVKFNFYFQLIHLMTNKRVLPYLVDITIWL